MFLIKNPKHAILPVVLLFTAVIFLLRPVADKDFFWHLKTGEWIWQNERLPDHDTFSYTTPAVLSPSAHFTMKAYWIAQILLYVSFLLKGMTGIVMLRFLLAFFLLYFMVLSREGERTIYTSLLILFSVSVFSFYSFDRPQVLSILFFSILLATLNQIKKGQLIETKRLPAYTLAAYTGLLMLVWSNSHGGYVLGQVILLLFMLLEGVKFLHPSLSPMQKSGYLSLVAAGISGILCSLINPNTYHAAEVVLEINANNSLSIKEFASMMLFLRLYHEHIVIAYLFFMALTVIVVAFFPKEADITEMALLLFAGYFAFMHVRYAAFFPIAALPILGRLLSKDSILIWSRRGLVLVALVTAAFFTRGEFANFTTAKEGAWIDDRMFPVKAADFILANKLTGNMYNKYEWGGYLIWRLSPERRVFIDGRGLDPAVFWDAMLINMAHEKSGANAQEWKSLLQKYRVNYIVTASYLPSGRLHPLVRALSKDKEWAPVFSHTGSNSMIFVRNIPDNAALIQNNPTYIF